MNKTTKLQLLAVALVFGLLPQNQYASDDDNDFNHGVSIIAGAAAGLTAAKFKLSGLGIFQSAVLTKTFSNPDSMAAPKHQPEAPYLKEWYNSLAKKYPQACFDTKQLLAGYNTSADTNKIYLVLNDALQLEQVLKKKITGQRLSQKELEKISETEWFLLHEATHIDNNDMLSARILGVGSLIGLELGYQKYKKTQPISISSTTWAQSTWKLTKSLPKRATIFATMLTASGAIMASYSRHYETRADALANEYADTNALKAASLFFNNHPQKDEIKKYEKNTPTFLQTHPKTELRIQNIEDEIKRRNEK